MLVVQVRVFSRFAFIFSRFHAVNVCAFIPHFENGYYCPMGAQYKCEWHNREKKKKKMYRIKISDFLSPGKEQPKQQKKIMEKRLQHIGHAIITYRIS